MFTLPPCDIRSENPDIDARLSVINRRLGLRVAIINADDITGRVAAILHRSVELAAAANQRQLRLPLQEDYELLEPKDQIYQTWHLCIYINDDVVRAELSRFTGFSAGYLDACRERIFIVCDGDSPGLNLTKGDDPGPDIDFDVQRKA